MPRYGTRDDRPLEGKYEDRIFHEKPVSTIWGQDHGPLCRASSQNLARVDSTIRRRSTANARRREGPWPLIRGVSLSCSPSKVSPPIRHNVFDSGGGNVRRTARIDSTVDGQTPPDVGNKYFEGETSVAEATRAHGLTVGEIEEWRGRFLIGAENVLRRRLKDEEALKEEQIDVSFLSFVT